MDEKGLLGGKNSILLFYAESDVYESFGGSLVV